VEARARGRLCLPVSRPCLRGRKERPASSGPIFVLSSFFSVFARRDTGEQDDPGWSLSGSILTEGRLERQFSVSDLGQRDIRFTEARSMFHEGTMTERKLSHAA